MKHILQAWQASLMLLLPKNIVPFFLVTIKTLIDVYRSMFFYFWWFMLAGAIGILTHAPLLFFIIWLMFWLLFLILAARPSTLIKDFTYYSSNMLYVLPFAVLLFVPLCCLQPIYYIFAPYAIIVLFFMCDANGKLSDLLWAPWRAANMVLMMLPLYVLIAALWYMLGYSFCCTVLPLWITFFVVIPFMVALISRLYVLHIHQHYQDYFGHCW